MTFFHNIKYLFLSVLIAGIFGCANNPQYIPKKITTHQNSNLALIENLSTFRNSKIDGVVVSSDAVFILPGKHLITYETYGENKLWKQLVETMEEKGFSLSKNRDLFFRRGTGGIVMTADPIGVSRFGWNMNTREVFVEAGEEYWFSELSESMFSPTSPPILHSARYGNTRLLKKMILKGRSINERDGNGDTALHLSASYGHFNAVKLLINSGADVNTPASYTGATPLDQAVYGYKNYSSFKGRFSGSKQDYIDIIKYLISLGGKTKDMSVYSPEGFFSAEEEPDNK